jgi:hypothetical protein
LVVGTIKGPLPATAKRGSHAVVPFVNCFGGGLPFDILQMPQVLGIFRTGLTAVALRLLQPLVISSHDYIETVLKHSQRVFHRANGGTQPVLCLIDEALGRCGIREMKHYGRCRDWQTVSSCSPPGGSDVARLRGGGLTLLEPRCVTGRVSETRGDVTIGSLQFCSYPVVICASLQPESHPTTKQLRLAARQVHIAQPDLTPPSTHTQQFKIISSVHEGKKKKKAH